MQYRIGNIDDFAKLRDLALISYGAFEHVLEPDDWNTLFQKLDAEDSYHKILDISKCFLCEADNLILGVAYLVPSGNPTKIFDKDWAYLRMVGVHPDYQGKGIGKQLTLQCIDYARETGEQVIALHTSEFMDAARHIYEKLGFRQVRELDKIFGKRYWLYQMKL